MMNLITLAFSPKLKISTSAIFILCILSTGCISAKTREGPNAESFPRTSQKEVFSTNHWAIIADELAVQIKQNLTSNKLLSRPVFINLESTSTNFTRTFNDFLITSLVNRGVSISKTRNGSTQYDYKIQKIVYKSNLRSNRLDDDRDQYDASNLIVSKQASMDVIFERNPKMEIIITTSLLDGNLYIARTSDIYYANDEDIHLYQNNGKFKKNNVFDDPFYEKN